MHNPKHTRQRKMICQHFEFIANTRIHIHQSDAIVGEVCVYVVVLHHFKRCGRQQEQPQLQQLLDCGAAVTQAKIEYPQITVGEEQCIPFTHPSSILVPFALPLLQLAAAWRFAC